ncbi:MAG: hypothetical protein IIU08_11325, partial [Clostridia bacterium]|nr:hypothetical protein [Clostridia bacterium]
YSKRLDSLCEIMALLSSDILVLVEIENEAVVQDITNRLAGSEWNKKRTTPPFYISMTDIPVTVSTGLVTASTGPSAEEDPHRG